MTIHWVYLMGAVLLLGFPVLLSRDVCRRLAKPSRVPIVKLTEMTGVPVNWLDFIRGAAGGYILTQMAILVTPGVAGAGLKALVIQGVVLVACLLLQVVRFWKELTFLGPVFYLSGIALTIPPWDVGLASVVIGCGFALATRTVACLLPVTGAVVAVYGYLLNGLNLKVMLTAVLLFLPVAVSLVFLKDLRYVDAKSGWVRPESGPKRPRSSVTDNKQDEVRSSPS